MPPPANGIRPGATELADQRTATSDTFQNPDGTKTTTFSQNPVNFKNPSTGKYEVIDPSLSAGLPGSTVPWYSNRSGQIQLQLAKQAGASNLVAATLPSGATIAWTLQGASSVPSELGGSVLNDPAPPGSEANRVVYRSLLAGVDAQLESRARGLKESLVLRSVSAPTVFTFPLTLSGVTARISATGDVELVRSDGSVDAVIPHGFMKDSSVNPLTGSAATSQGVTYTLAASGTSVNLVMTIDAAWVNDPARVFPIVVDPTLTTNSAFYGAADDTFVQENANADHSGLTELDAGNPPGYNVRTEAYVQFPNISILNNQHIVNANFGLAEFQKGGSCSATPPIGLYQVTQGWSGSTMTGWPGAQYWYIPMDTTTVFYGTNCSPYVANWVYWGNGNSSVRDVVNSWLDGAKPNYGFAIRPVAGSEYDSNGWRKYWSAQTIAPPTLTITWNSFDASYAQADALNLPTGVDAGSELVYVLNKGTDTWPVGSLYGLSYHLYKSDGTFVGDGPRTYIAGCTGQGGVAADIAPGQAMWCRVTINPTPPGNYVIYFDMVDENVTWFSGHLHVLFTDGQGVTPYSQAFSVANLPPTLTASSVSAATTLTPVLSVTATDQDNYPNTGLTYNFNVCTGADGNSGSCSSSGTQSAATWTVPAGFLSWSQSYYWNVVVTDGLGAANRFAVPGRLTQVPAQPTSAHDGIDPVSTSVFGINPFNGNFTTGAQDLAVSGVGPEPTVTRTYNSADPRTGSTMKFGTSWSSPFDMSVATDTGSPANVVVSYPDGRQVRFGVNPDGTFASPPSMFATLSGTKAAGYVLVDKDGFTYTFGVTDGPLQTIKDPSGRVLTLTYTSGHLTRAAASPSGRALNFVWTGSHVTSVTTDAISGHTNFAGSNQPYTYTYTYSTDLLTDVCNAKSFDAQTCSTKKTHYSYGTFGSPSSSLLTGITEPKGNQPTQLNYNSDKTVQWYKDANAAQWSFAYQTVNSQKTITVTDPATHSKVFGYDANSRLTTLVDENGATRRFAYNDLGYQSRATDANGHTTLTAFDIRGNVLRKTVNRTSGPGFAPAVAAGTSPSIWWRLGESTGTSALNSASASCPSGPCATRAGTYVGSPALNGVGPLNGDTSGAPTFDGATQYVSNPNSAWNDQLGDVTFSAWVRTDPVTPAPTYQAVVLKKDTSGSASYALRIENDSRLVYYHNNATSAETHGINYAFTPGTWYYVGFVRSGNNIILYINGVPVDQETRVGAPLSNAGQFAIGAWQGSSGVSEAFKGAISDATFYASAQSSTFIQSLYAAGLNTAYRNLLPAGSTAPSAWYRLGDTGNASACGGTAGITACDASGNNAHATYTNVTGSVPGAIAGDGDGAANFDGTSSYVTLPASVGDTTGGITIEAWVKPTSVASYERIVDLSAGAQQDEIAFTRFAATDELLLEVWGGSSGTTSGYLTTPAGALPLNTWSYVVATVDPAGNAAIYRNGVQLVAGSVPVPRSAIRTVDRIGQSPFVGDPLFQGNIDEVAIYPRRLSYADISAHAAAGTAAGPNSATTVTSYTTHYRTPYTSVGSATVPGGPLTDSPLGYWRLGEATGVTSAADSSSHNANGTIDAGVKHPRTGAIVNDTNASLLTTGTGGLPGPISAASGVTTTQKSFTLESWVNVPDTSQSGAFIMTGPGSTNGVGLGVGGPLDGSGSAATFDHDGHHNGNRLVALYEGVCWIDSTMTIGTGWHDVGLRVEANGSATFFLDGTKLINKTKCTDGTTTAIPGATRSSAWSVGGYSITVNGTTYNRLTNGVGVDEAAIYGSLVTDQHMKDHYLVGTWHNNDPRNDHVTEQRDARSAGPSDNNYRTQTTYDTSGRVTTKVSPGTAACSAGCTATATYTTGAETAYGGVGTMPAGLLKQLIDPRLKIVTYSYDNLGDLRQTTNPLGLVATNTYDAIGRITQAATTPGGTTTTTYDALSSPATVTSPAVTNAVTGLVHQSRTTNTYDDNELRTQTQISDVGGSAQPDTTRNTSFGYDTNDILHLTTDAQNQPTQMDHDAFGRVTLLTDAQTHATQYDYTPTGQLQKTTIKNFVDDPLAQPPTSPRDVIVDQRSYDPAGRLAQRSDALGHVTTFSYTDDGLPINTIQLGYHNLGSGTTDVVLDTKLYDAAGNVTGELTGNWSRYVASTYDNAGHLSISTLDPAGLNRTTTLSYDGAGNVSSSSVADANRTDTTTHLYDDANNLLTTSMGGITTSVVRDPRGFVTASIDGRNNQTDVTLDVLGRASQVQTPAVTWEQNGGTPQVARPTTLTGYDTFNDPAQLKDPRGNTSTKTYDTLGQLTASSSPTYTPPGGSAITPTTNYGYDTLNRLHTVTDPRNQITTFDYDARGRLLRTLAPTVTGVGTPTTRAVYDDASENVQTVNPVGATTNTAYDDLGRIRTKTVVERTPTLQNLVTTSDYDFRNNPTYQQTPAGDITTATFDAANEFTGKTIDPGTGTHLNQTTTFGYDVSGRPIQTTDARGRKTVDGFDPAGRRTSRVTYDETNTATNLWFWSYDNNSNTTSYTPPNGFFSYSRTATYDAGNQLSTMVTPVDTNSANDITTSFGYDLNGNRTRVTDGRTNATITSYNPLNLAETVTEPSTPAFPNPSDRATTTKYDAGGLPTELDQPGGVVRTRTFNEVGALTAENGTGGGASAATRTLGYDLAGRPVTAGHPSGTETFGYNDRNQVVSSGGPTGTATFAYDAAGRLNQRVDAAGTANFTYRPDRQINTATDPLTGTTRNYHYNVVGRLDSIDFGTNNATRAYGYDNQDRLTSDTLAASGGATLQTTTYGYDPDSNITSRSVSPTGVAGSGNQGYTYDRLDRLATWTDTNTVQTTYGYDKSSNRTSSANATTTLAAAFDARNRQTSKTITTSGVPTSGTSSYTARGTLASQTFGATTTTYNADAFSRITAVGGATYTYDSLDRLATAASAAFTYAGTQPEPTSDGTFTYGRGPSGELASLKKGSTSVAALTDHHGDLVADFNPAGTTLADSRAYDPWGQVSATTGTTNPTLGYQAQWTDASTNQTHMGARWYQPNEATFTTTDPKNNPPTRIDGINRYVYAGDNPVTQADPRGTDGEGATIAVGGCAVQPELCVGAVVVAGGVEVCIRYCGAAWNEVQSWFGDDAPSRSANQDQTVPYTDSWSMGNGLEGIGLYCASHSCSPPGTDPGQTRTHPQIHRYVPPPPRLPPANFPPAAPPTPLPIPADWLPGAAQAVTWVVEATVAASAAAAADSAKVDAAGPGTASHPPECDAKPAIDNMLGHILGSTQRDATTGIALANAASLGGSSNCPPGPRSKTSDAAAQSDKTGTSGTNGGAAADRARLASRTDELTGVLDPIAQNSRTSAVMSTREGTDVLAGGGRDLIPAQRALAQGDDVLGRLPGAHAEITAMDAADKAGLTPWQMEVSRPICAACQTAIEGSGGTVAPGGMFAWWAW